MNNNQERKLSDADGTPKSGKKDDEVEHKPDLTGIKVMDGLTNAQMYRTIAGCVLIHLVIGTLYVWGGVSPYVSSFLKAKDDTITQHKIAMIFPFMVFFVNTSTTLGVKLCDRFPPMYVVIIISSIMLSSILIVSFMETLAGYIVFYMVFFGLCSGMIYLIPLKIAWGYFPEKKGTVSGLILFGYGFGAFIFNFVAKAIVNPNNLKPTLTFKEGSETAKYFTQEVYQHVPTMFRILFACYSVMIICAVLLIKWPHHEKPIEHPIHHHTHEQHPHKRHNSWSWHVVKNEHEHHHHRFVTECPSIKEGITTYAFWSMFLLAVFMIYFGQFLINNYKHYGVMFTALDDDTYLTTIGSLSAACNGSSRIFWATLFDKFGFKCVFFSAALIQTILSATLTLTTNSRTLYGIWICLALWCMGCYFATFGPHTAKLFGHKLGPQFYSFVLIGIGIGNMIAFGMRQAHVELFKCFWVGFGFTLAGMILVGLQKSVYQWEVEEDEEDIKYLEGEHKDAPREGPRRLSRKASSALVGKLMKQTSVDLTKETDREKEKELKEVAYHKFD